MKKQFIETKTRYAAKKVCPWASKFAKVVGGYMAFESVTDYETFKRTK